MVRMFYIENKVFSLLTTVCAVVVLTREYFNPPENKHTIICAYSSPRGKSFYKIQLKMLKCSLRAWFQSMPCFYTFSQNYVTCGWGYILLSLNILSISVFSIVDIFPLLWWIGSSGGEIWQVCSFQVLSAATSWSSWLCQISATWVFQYDSSLCFFS